MERTSNKNIKFGCKYRVFWILQGNGGRKGARESEKSG